jgi:hypothetical protein
MKMPNESSVPLIARRTFFENANAVSPRVSPDGLWLAWLGGVDGVMNVWASPRDDLAKARPLTRQTGRPIFAHWLARTSEARQGQARAYAWAYHSRTGRP